MKKRNYIIILVLLMVIGFASVATNLIINGNVGVGVNQNDFDVYFSNAIVNDVENKKIIKDNTHISFSQDMSMKDETYTLEYDVTNGSRSYDAAITISCTETDEYIIVENVFDTTSNLLATETRSGTLTINVKKSYVSTEENPTYDKEITCTIVATPVEREVLSTGTPAEKVEQDLIDNPTIYEKGLYKLTDNDYSEDLSIGDLITLDTESFYVYNIEGDTVKALAQYNLYVGNSCTEYSNLSCTPLEDSTGLQDSRTIGYLNSSTPRVAAVPFITFAHYSKITASMNPKPKYNDYSISTIKNYVDEYAIKLKNIDSGIQKVRLITKKELEDLGCDSENQSCKPEYNEDETIIGSPYEWTYSTPYWTSSTYENSIYDVWRVHANGYFGIDGCFDESEPGVRPVIEISKSVFE